VHITTNVNMPHPTPTLQLRSIATCVHITTNVNKPHPTPTLQLRSIATCVHITTNTNMPHPKNNNPRGGGESAAYQKQANKPQQKATHMIRFCCPQASFSVTLASGCDKASRNRCTPLAGKRGGKQLANCCLNFETLMFLDKIKTNGKPLALFKHFCIFLQYLRTLVRRKELVGAQITLITIRRGSLAFPLDRFAPPMPT